MVTIDIGDAAVSGVRLLARRPLSALAWAVLPVAFMALMLALFGGSLLAMVGAFAIRGGTTRPLSGELLGLFGAVAGFYLLFVAGSMVMGAVLQGAVFRSILSPGETAFASMRLGARELWLILLAFVSGLLMVLIQLLLAIPQLIIVGVVTLSAPNMAVPARLVAELLTMVVVVWLYLRFSLAAPMTFAESKLRLFESWSLTKGHVWSLLVVAILVGLMAGAVYVVLTLVGLGGGVAIWQAIPHAPSAEEFFRDPGPWLGDVEGLIGLVAVLMTIGGVALIPVLIAPWAEIYRRLRADSDIPAVFN